MDLSEAELRQIVRAAIARERDSSRAEPQAAPPLRITHSSHVLLPLARGGDADGACVVEPSVRCNHCGYCVSFGH